MILRTRKLSGWCSHRSHADIFLWAAISIFESPTVPILTKVQVRRMPLADELSTSSILRTGSFCPWAKPAFLGSTWPYRISGFNSISARNHMPAARVGNGGHPHRAVGMQIRKQLSRDVRHWALLAEIRRLRLLLRLMCMPMIPAHRRKEASQPSMLNAHGPRPLHRCQHPRRCRCRTVSEPGQKANKRSEAIEQRSVTVRLHSP